MVLVAAYTWYCKKSLAPANTAGVKCHLFVQKECTCVMHCGNAGKREQQAEERKWAPTPATWNETVQSTSSLLKNKEKILRIPKFSIKWEVWIDFKKQTATLEKVLWNALIHTILAAFTSVTTNCYSDTKLHHYTLFNTRFEQLKIYNKYILVVGLD